MRVLLLLLSIFFSACTVLPSPEQKTAAAINAQLGMAYLEQHQLIAAKQKLLLALEQYPADPLVNDAFAYFLEKSGSIPNAEKYYLRAIQLAKHPGKELNNYGTFLFRQQRYAAALQVFQQATQDLYYLTPASAYANAGFAALKLKNNALAKEYFSKSLAFDPNNQRVKLQLKAEGRQ